jgi:hypothetical protein
VTMPRTAQPLLWFYWIGKLDLISGMVSQRTWRLGSYELTRKVCLEQEAGGAFARAQLISSEKKMKSSCKDEVTQMRMC